MSTGDRWGSLRQGDSKREGETEQHSSEEKRKESVFVEGWWDGNAGQAPGPAECLRTVTCRLVSQFCAVRTMCLRGLALKCHRLSVFFQLQCDRVVTAISVGQRTLHFKINRELLTKVSLAHSLACASSPCEPR